ncbi:type II toxin-antitoxin system RelB/DinJ family antitoxin [Leptotrichia wadei]|uniref:type II toxin-antitoxin system RelB/DinJ family antitoxin n=1 Tax=Leptotrichia wadei TaxID=157687 RepID=UPI0028E6208C|nr:type II toxin-antitoxin system RelB/DinJ family antitoxin [Leptotrichia wadei]
MANTNLSIRVDKETKEKANELFNKFGLTMTTAVNMFLKTAIRENRIPFELKLEEEPNEVTMKVIEEGRRIAKDDSVKGYDSIEELREALDV